MDWYYAANGQQAGPVNDEQLLQLAQSGVVGPETLVWHAGMANWQPFRVAGPGAPPPFPGPVNPQPAYQQPMYQQPAYQQPVYAPAAGVRYAGFWIRAGALIIDGIILSIISRIVAVLVLGGSIFDLVTDVVNTGHGGDISWVGRAVGLGMAAQAINVVVSAVYQAFFLPKYGATPGKMVCGLKVVTPSGAPVTPVQAIGRYLASILSAIILGIGNIMVAFDDQKRSLHDRLAETRVIHSR